MKLQIKTCDGVDLDTVSRSQSETIQRALRDKQKDLIKNSEESQSEMEVAIEDGHNTEVTNQSIRLYKLNFKELLFMALTSGAIGVAFAAVSPIIGSLSNVIPWNWLTDEFAQISEAIFVIVLMMVAMV